MSFATTVLPPSGSVKPQVRLGIDQRNSLATQVAFELTERADLATSMFNALTGVGNAINPVRFGTGIVNKLTEPTAFAIGTTNYNAKVTDYIIGVSTAAIAGTVTLPLLNSVQLGQTFIVQDEGGSAAVRNITVTASGTDTIHGTAIINGNYTGIFVYAGTGAWFAGTFS